MTFSLKPFCYAGLVAACLALSGCLPPASTQLDEEKEPHFLEGKNRVNSMDFSGAIESFQRALEANPKSASAHFELGWLYDQREADPAAAIYHYSQFVKLHHEGEKAERAKARIMTCKQELARTVSLAPVAQNMQRDLENLAAENKKLRTELEMWRAARATELTNSIGVVRPAPSALPSTRLSTSSIDSPASRQESANVISRSLAPGTHSNIQVLTRLPSTATTSRTHTVKSGETPAAIARKYGVKLDALVSANPNLDPRRLQIGQTLSIP